MKKSIAIILTAAMLLCAAPLAGFVAGSQTGVGSLFPSARAAETVDSGTCGKIDEQNGLDGSQMTWTLDSNGLLTISGKGDMQDYRWDSPWKENQDILSVAIQNGVTSVGSYAFVYCSRLTGVTMPDSVTSIGERAFYYCTQLADAAIPAAVTSIGSYAFAGCMELTTVTIPAGVTRIEDGTFSTCVKLTDLTIPDSVAAIGNYVFSTCENLTEATIPDGVTEIGNSLFAGCRKLTSVTIPDSVTMIGSGAFSRCESLAEITIPDGVTVIGDTAFFECGALKEITLPGCLTELGGSAFSDCGSLTCVTIPDRVARIGEGVFANCAGLTELKVGPKNRSFSGVDNCIIQNDNGTLVAGCKASRIPADGSVKRIGRFAFSGCEGLVSLTIPDSVTEIGNNAFTNCADLAEITIPGDVTEIAPATFYRCESLTEVTIPDGVTKIGYSAFSNCAGLASVTIPDSVTEIGASAFSYCGKLSAVTIPDGVTTIENSLFYDCARLTAVTIPDGVTEIGNYAFEGCAWLTEITIPDNVAAIGMYAFSDCAGITAVTIPAKVTKLGSGAFSGCANLAELKVDEKNPVYCGAGNCIIERENKTLLRGGKNSVIPADGSVTVIGDDAFSGCTGLTEMTIPDAVTRIGDDAFRDCVSLTDVTIPDSVTDVGSSAFSGCTGLTSVTIPDSMTKINSFLFFGCTGLTDVTIPDSVTDIVYKAFSNCSSLKSFRLPAGVKSFTGTMISGCAGLTELSVSEENPVYRSEGNCIIETDNNKLVLGCRNSVIPTDGSVTEIGGAAFSGCTGLTEVTIPDGVTKIGGSAFEGCTGLTSVTVPDGVTKIGGSAFNKCTALTGIRVPVSVTEIGRASYGTIPTYTMIYGAEGSYAQRWAKENGRAFTAIDVPSVTLQAPTTVNEPKVSGYGFANPGATVTCSVNGKEAAAQADGNGRWSAEIPLTGAKDGDSFTVEAAVTQNGKTAAKTAEVQYRPAAVLFRSFVIQHRTYRVSVSAGSLNAGKRNLTYVPGNPTAFRIRVTNNDRIDKLFVVSTKDGESKRMELTYDKDSGCWFANGFFDKADKNYVPGAFTVIGIDKDGKEFDAGVTIKINFLIDPSGYAYEAVQSNKLEGVRAEVYYKDADGHELLWNAETADQLNPVTTLADGAFAWVVPEGQWQVRLTKDGYEEAVSEWMDVPPERTNVYISIISNKAPELAYCNIYADRAEITFSQYMDIDSVNADNVTFEGYKGAIAPVDRTETAAGSGVFYAKTFSFTPTKAFSGEVSVAINGVKNYADKEMTAPYTATFTVAAEPKNLTVSQDVAVAYGKTAEITVSAENAAGKAVTVACDSANITLSAENLTLDETGKATLAVTGEMPGTAGLTFTLDGTVLTASAKVAVEVPGVPAELDEPGPATPTDPDQPGPATPTDPDQPGPATPTDPDQPGPATPTDPDQPTYALGDVDGDGEVSSGDARLALRASVQLEKYAPGSAQFLAADADKNGEIESSDARTILRVSVKLESF